MIADCASDPPLGATLRSIAVRRAGDVVYGLGALAVGKKWEKLAVAARHEDAALALRDAIARAEAKVEVRELPDAWPPPLPSAHDARVLVEIADRAHNRNISYYTTIAGAVNDPAVLALRGDATMAELIARADGASCDDWVPVAGGLPAGRVVARETTFEEAGRPSLVLALPIGHPGVARLRTPIADWLLRAASACEGCRVCSDACAHLQPHEVVWTLATARDDGTELARALNCTHCGLCDVMCPSSLSPRALVADVKSRMTGIAAPPASAAAAPGLDVGLMILRLGLADYVRTPRVSF